MKSQRNRARHHLGLILTLVALMGGVNIMSGPGRLAFVQATVAGWTSMGSLNTARDHHSSTLLSNGKVLVAGGVNSVLKDGLYQDTILNSAELYNPATGTWNYTGSLHAIRLDHTATLLPNGKVLVAGGSDYNGLVLSAELYDPPTGTWSLTGNLNTARSGYTATLLQNGKVLVAGGLNLGGPTCVAVRSAELYDPATGSWSYTGTLNTGRLTHSATLLPNGKVLVTGGSCNGDDDVVFSNAELYDPTTGSWTNAGNLLAPRVLHKATLLGNGKVLVAGGRHGVSGYFNDAELYDPVLQTSTATQSLHTPHSGGETVTLLQSGKVLVAGENGTNNSELYDPTTGTWSLTGNLSAPPRYSYTATVLQDGTVVAVGGHWDESTSSAELFGATNAIDDAQFFVRQHYLDFLNREPDAGGLVYWTERITGDSRNDPAPCPVGDTRCVNERRIGVSAAFFIEQEFQDTGYFVYRFYKASLGRQPSYAEFTSDRSLVVSGSDLEASKQAFADEWVQRPAFVTVYPITMSNTEVVNKLFDSAGLTASIYDAQRQQEIVAMNAGRSRALVLRDVNEIPDFKNIPDPNDPRYIEIKQTSQYNPAFVLMQYFGYLHRDLDRTGYDFWLDVVNNRQPNNYHGMVCSFITSSEYQLRFGSVVTHSNADCSQ